MVKTVMITGASSGLGKEAARQLAMIGTTEKVYLACRNKEKATVAQQSLIESTGRSIFEIVLLDTSDMDSVRSAAQSLNHPIEGLVMNAGGMGGRNYNERTKDGVIRMFAVNLLGHVVLLEELLKLSRVTKVAIFSASEAARGVPRIGLNPPKLESYSVDEFISICHGTFFEKETDPTTIYQFVKYLGALYMASLARLYPDVRLLTVSPGSTTGTDIYKDMPFSLYRRIRLRIILALHKASLLDNGLFHGVEAGAKRYVDALNDDSYQTGVFYGSEQSAVTGPLTDQGIFFADLYNENYQDNAYQAIHSFIGR
jgi:NAD(P)-dependent dehydrogenase (short-subunit alcohol dehydrogenase family)